jgi:hypothetical protein
MTDETTSLGGFRPVFSGRPDDWFTWCMKFKAVLEDKDLLEYLGAKRPGATAKEKQAEYDKANKKIYGKIVSLVKGAAIGIIMPFEETRDGNGAWAALKAKYELKGRAQKSALQAELMKDELSSDEDPDAYFARIEAIQRRLRELEVDVSDETMIGIASARLPSAYDALQVLFDADDELTYDAFKERVRVFYRRAITKNIRNHGAGLSAVVFNGRCHKCGQVGHRRKDCKNKATVKCHKCGKMGHVAKFCKSRASGDGGDDAGVNYASADESF